MLPPSCIPREETHLPASGVLVLLAGEVNVIYIVVLYCFADKTDLKTFASPIEYSDVILVSLTV